MDDRDFFDLLYAQWTKTTAAEDHYWMPELDFTEEEDLDDGTAKSTNFYTLSAVKVDEEGNQDKKPVASYLSEEDADFISGVHGCFGDLVKRLHAAVDEADRLDLELDNTLGRVLVLELEADEFSSIIGDLTEHISQLESGRV